MPDSSAACPFSDDSDIDARYLAGRLSAAEAEAFEAHYFACDRCFALVQRGAEIRASLGATASGAANELSLETVRARRARGMATHWRPALVAAVAVLVIGISVWRAVPRSPVAGTPNPATGSEALRGDQLAFAVSSHATSSLLVAAWSPRPRAKSYRVRLLTVNGSLLFERETTDTSVMLPIDSLPGVLAKAPVYWEVQALDALRGVVATSAIVQAALHQSPP